MQVAKKMLAMGAAGLIGLLGAASAARAQYVFANFEDGTPDGFGTLGNSGVTPNSFTSPTAGSVITPGSGSDTTKVLDLTAAGFNGGLGSGADLGYDFVANGLMSQFFANDVITFQWEVAPGNEPSGYAQFYNIILNAPGIGFQNVGGTSGATNIALATVTGAVNQYPPFSGQLNTVSINYDGAKAAILANTPNPGYIQLAFQTNDANPPTDFYFDNFTLSAVPEPTSIGLLAVGALSLLHRRRSV
ncbi:MAG TPA: PEP-CTERM sorting domain-containing protein [Tepidisphaeraceae bacterium]|nr:PEP-CTERM sorting domain-containing protein [Tepidisphaeraceae bacterium]